jgi:hypothetical protein
MSNHVNAAARMPLGLTEQTPPPAYGPERQNDLHGRNDQALSRTSRGRTERGPAGEYETEQAVRDAIDGVGGLCEP